MLASGQAGRHASWQAETGESAMHTPSNSFSSITWDLATKPTRARASVSPSSRARCSERCIERFDQAGSEKMSWLSVAEPDRVRCD